MKLNDVYWIYSIECNPTGKIYVGQTGKPNPCWRWADHVVSLRNGFNTAPLLQEEWNAHPDLTSWTFRPLDRVDGKRAANEREAERILAVPVDRRLNTSKTSTVSMDRRLRVEEMLSRGCKYRDIQDAVGISLGMISKIKRLQDK